MKVCSWPAVNKFCVFKEQEGSLLTSQQDGTGSALPKSTRSQSVPLQSVSTFLSHANRGLSDVLDYRSLFISHHSIRVVWPAHLISLYLITIIIFGRYCNLRRFSFCNILQPPVLIISIMSLKCWAFVSSGCQNSASTCGNTGHPV